MQKKSLRIVHYLNQFFGGVGGEDKAHIEPQVIEGAVGPGVAVQNILGEQGKVVATVICGDNTFAEKIDETAEEVLELIRPSQPDAVIAGPAFAAGRYGIACGAVCKAVQERLGIPTATGMYEENPGIDLFRQYTYIVKTPKTGVGMVDAVSKMVGIVARLAAGQRVGKPSEEGYFSRGLMTNDLSAQTGAERAVAMLLNKLRGRPFESEISLPQYDRVEPAPRIQDMSSATVALITDGGLVPTGNPDKIESVGATRFGAYSIEGIDGLHPDDYEVYHIGYDPIFVHEDPNRLVPVDVMRDMEKEGVIGKLHNKIYSTSGAVCIVENIRRIGQAIAEELKAEGVSSAILTSTWGTSTRGGATLSKELERAGIPTAHMCSIVPVAQMVGSNRIVKAHKIVTPVGNANLDPIVEKAFRRSLIEKALDALTEDAKGEQLE